MRQKQLYAAPATEVLELRLEGNLLSGSPFDKGVGITRDDAGTTYDGGGENWYD